MEEEINAESEASAVAAIIAEYSDVPLEEVIEAGTEVCPGCGVLLGLRLAMKTIGANSKIIAAGDHAAVFGTTSKVPYIAVKKLRVPDLKQKEVEGKEKQLVLCYDGTNNIDDIIDAAGKCDLVISVVTEPGKDLTRTVSTNVDYSATASISNPVDFLEKIKQALTYQKSFIELLAPCPVVDTSKLDPSNTVEAAKMAVDSGLFPLFIAKKTDSGIVVKFTYKPAEASSVGEYYRLIGIKKTAEEITKEQILTADKLSLLSKGRF